MRSPHRRATAQAVVLIFLGLVVSGCTQGTDPGPTLADAPAAAAWLDVELPMTELAEIRPFEATSADGTALRGHVYMPEGPGPFATVLELSPYWNTASPYGPSEDNEQTVGGRRTMGLWHAPLMDAGFAVALVNMRGTGESEGCFQFGASIEADDAYAVIEGLAAEPWSNGRVGMVGLSYPGWSQYLALQAAPPSLKAVVPSSGVIDVHSLVTRNGASLSIGPAVSPLWTAGTALGVYAIARTSGVNEEPFVPDTDASHATCPRYGPDFYENGALVWNGDRTRYWKDRDYRPALAESDVPIFVTNGMTTGEGHILQFEGLWDLLPTENKRFMLGQHGHAYPTGVRPDFPAMQLAWLDHWLRDGPELVPDGVVEYQDDTGTWHNATQWPPAATYVTLYLSDDRLVPDPQDARGQRAFQSTHEGPRLGDCHDGQVVYVSEPMAEDTLLAGNFYVNVTVTSTLPDGNLAAYLFHTPGAGRCGDPEADEVRRALTDLRHRTPGYEGEDFPIGTPTPVSIRSHPFASLVPAGDRLVLVVAGESSELTPELRKPELTISSGADDPAHVTLPVLVGAATLT